MKKLIISGGLVFLILIVYLSIFAKPSEKGIIRYTIDPSADNILDFQHARVKITGWNNDYIQVKTDDYIMTSGMPVHIEQQDNRICLDDFKPPEKKNFTYKLNTFIIPEQFSSTSASLEIGITDFEIMVPKNIAVKVNADYVKAYYCKLQAVETPDAVIRECKLAVGYTGKGKKAVVRDTDIGDAAVFNNQKLEIRDCDTGSLCIGTEKASGVLEALLRDNKGDNLTIDVPDYNALSILIRDSDYEGLNVNSAKETGEITLLRARIKKLDNQSGIEIKKVKRMNWNGW